jgi:hypothetical protein
MTTFCPISPPTTVASLQGTPMTQASGANSRPRRPAILVGRPSASAAPVISPSQVSGASISAIRAMKASSMAPMFRARRSPSAAPPAAASMTLLVVFSTSIFTVPRVSGSPVSGMRIFATTSVAGAAMIDAASKCLA